MRGASDGYRFTKPVAFEDLRHADAVVVSHAIIEYIHADAHGVSDYPHSLADGLDADSDAHAVTEHFHADVITEHDHHADSVT